jgi:F-type H+-transporting ATPase subunit delta
MATRLSRRKLANYWADRLLAGDDAGVLAGQLAAYLSESRRTRELTLLVREIEQALLDRGVVVADITSARELTPEITKSIETFLKSAYNSSSVVLRQEIDESVIGGVRIETPDAQADTTVRRLINNIKASKV